MAKVVYVTNTGEVAGLWRSSVELGMFTVPSNASTVDFDPAANPNLLSAWDANHASVTAPAGVVEIDGVPYTIIAASQDYTTSALVKQAISALKGTENLPSLATIGAAFTAVQNGTATNAQAQLALSVVMRLLGLMAQKLINNGTINGS